MTEMMIHPPRTIMEVFRMLPEGTLAEVIDNQLYMSPTPVSNHQRMVGKLFTSITLHVEAHALGEVFIAPIDVFLDIEENAVQPDIFFISEQKSSIVQDNGYIHGVPDLIIEVLSPGNSKHDLIVKKNLYEKFGVQEYWVVDPKTKLATGYSLKANSYGLIVDKSDVLTSQLLQKTFLLA